MTQLYYETNKEAARKLIASQIIDGWTLEDISNYFYALSYDIFFINSVVKPFFINISQSK